MSKCKAIQIRACLLEAIAADAGSVGLSSLAIPSYRVYTSLRKGVNGRNPPVLSRLYVRGNPAHIAPLNPLGKGDFQSPLSKGVGGFRSQNEVNHTCVYTVAIASGSIYRSIFHSLESSSNGCEDFTLNFIKSGCEGLIR